MKYTRRTIWLLVPAVLLVFLDQWTKHLAVTHLKGQSSYVLIPGVFQLTYVENTGAAFSILEGKQTFFTIVTLLVLVFLLYVWFRIPQEKRMVPLQVVLVLILSGAVGNLIDRISQRYVVDFLYFSLIDFPVFNVADCYVTVSCILFFLLFLFYYKEEDTDALYAQILPKKRREDEN